MIAAGAYYGLYLTAKGNRDGGEPKRALENVRGKAQELEAEQARRAEEALRRTRD